MKIQVSRGEVPIRTVTVRRHNEARLLYSVTITTPLDKHPLVTVGSAVIPPDGLCWRVELHRARRSAAEFFPSVVAFTPDTLSEIVGWRAGLFEIEWQSWAVNLIALPEDSLSGSVVANWEEFAAGRADYIE
jgi:hypothetical protein